MTGYDAQHGRPHARSISLVAPKPLAITRVEFFAVRDAPALLAELQTNAAKRAHSPADESSAAPLWPKIVAATSAALYRGGARTPAARQQLAGRALALQQARRFDLPPLVGSPEQIGGEIARKALREKRLLSLLALWPSWHLAAFDPDRASAPQGALLRVTWQRLTASAQLLRARLYAAQRPLVERLLGDDDLPAKTARVFAALWQATAEWALTDLAGFPAFASCRIATELCDNPTPFGRVPDPSGPK